MEYDFEAGPEITASLEEWVPVLSHLFPYAYASCVLLLLSLTFILRERLCENWCLMITMTIAAFDIFLLAPFLQSHVSELSLNTQLYVDVDRPWMLIIVWGFSALPLLAGSIALINVAAFFMNHGDEKVWLGIVRLVAIAFSVLFPLVDVLRERNRQELSEHCTEDLCRWNVFKRDALRCLDVLVLMGSIVGIISSSNLEHLVAFKLYIRQDTVSRRANTQGRPPDNTLPVPRLKPIVRNAPMREENIALMPIQPAAPIQRRRQEERTRAIPGQSTDLLGPSPRRVSETSAEARAAARLQVALIVPKQINSALLCAKCRNSGNSKDAKSVWTDYKTSIVEGRGAAALLLAQSKAKLDHETPVLTEAPLYRWPTTMSATVTLTKPRKKRSLPIKANGVLKKEEVEEPTTTTAKVQSKADKADKAAKSQIDYYDSSDEEDLRNTIGNIPVQWYDDLNHIGYDLEGEKIAKPAKKDQIDIFLQKMEDPDYWRKVMDKQTGTEITLSEEQIEQIHSLSSGKCPTIGYNPYQPFLDIYSQDTTIHPVDNVPASKQSFIPSKDEMRKVAKLVDAIRRGWLKPRKPKEKATKTYDLWADESEEARQKTKSEMARIRMHFPAPKVTLPGNVESYNPPEEYLLDDDEKKKWEEEEPEDRPMNYQPTKFDSMRRVPSYDNFVRERFERCLDLYLAPRQRKMRLEVKDHTDLLPDLPNPADLKPFPTTLAFFMTGHRGQVRALSFEPSGTELLASGGEDGDVRIWSVASGRCVKVHSLGSPITSMAYCPSKDKCILAVAVEGKKVILLNAESGDRLQVSSTATFIAGLPVGEHDSKIVWKRTDKAHGRLTLDMPSEIRQVVWHAKGDYFATVGTVDSADAVFIHQLSKAKSQMPFSKRKGQVRAVSFAVTVPHLFVATQRHVRVYDLGRCNLVKKLQCNMQAISTIQADNAGENLFVGGLDRRMSWMDLQMGTKPWKTLRHHASAIRGIAYHRRLPLLCTAGDDGQAIVYHARIYTDVFRESEIVPVKRLGAHEKIDDKVILACEWHPTRAWLATGGADGKIAFFSH